MFDNNIKKPFLDLFSFDWLFNSSNNGGSGIAKKIDSNNFISNMLSDIIGVDIQQWLDDFTSDPLGTLGIDLSGFDVIGGLLGALFGVGLADTNGVLEFLNTNIISPISETLLLFFQDPVSFIGELGFNITQFLDIPYISCPHFSN